MAAENTISQIQVENVTYNLVDVTAVDRVAQVMYKGPIHVDWTSDFYSYGNYHENDLRYCIWGPLISITGQGSPTADIPADASRTMAFLPEEATDAVDSVISVQQGSTFNIWTCRVYDSNQPPAVADTLGFERYRAGNQVNIATAGCWLPLNITFMNERFFN